MASNLERSYVRSGYLHRKLWEFSYIAQALLHERHLLDLAHAVGDSPLARSRSRSLRVYGAKIVATDLPPDAAPERTGYRPANTPRPWSTKSTATRPEDLFRSGFRFALSICETSRRPRTFDFIWSSCALEHLGSLDVANTSLMIPCAGQAPRRGVHTTEYNTSLSTVTVRGGRDVLYLGGILGDRETAKRSWIPQ